MLIILGGENGNFNVRKVSSETEIEFRVDGIETIEEAIKEMRK